MVRTAPLPAPIAAAIERAYQQLNAGHQAAVAVRSSATTEDAADASFAGLQDTFLWVQSLEQTLDKVRSCWGSLYSVESIIYRRRHAFAESDVAMAVVVQTMVDARTAGVMFTRSPLTGDRSVMALVALQPAARDDQVGIDRDAGAGGWHGGAVRDDDEPLPKHAHPGAEEIGDRPRRERQRIVLERGEGAEAQRGGS